MARLWTAMLKAAPLRLWVLFGVGPVLTILAALMCLIVWKGDMNSVPVELAGRRLDFLGWAFLILLANFTVIIITLAAVKVKAHGPNGVGFEVGGADDSEEPRG